MKSITQFTSIAILALCTLNQQAAEANEFPPDVAQALSQETGISAKAIERLRAGGPEAFERLLDLRDQFRQDPAGQAGENPHVLNDVIDQVGGARYSSVSGLYWHTDLDQAIAEAKSTKKPILSLQMMGRLTDEYSCANSRFFRTTLYANQEISKHLKENYVLHWKSVRPVPKVTIDFGDGRKLERTLTGNSIHYVLSSDGFVIDGLPGLYSPAKFLAWLKEVQPSAVAYGQFPGTQAQMREGLKSWHARRAGAIVRRWKSDLDAVALMEAETARGQQANQKNPPAAAAAMLAIPKGALELPVIANIMRDTKALEAQTESKTWIQIANRHLPEVKLDHASVELIRAENPVIPGSSQTKLPEGEDAIARIVAAFEKAIAQDTIRNEYLLHLKLHEWFAQGTAPADLEQLNERVYAELFLTPREDPWIGLVPANTYTGLTNGGVVAPN